MNNKITIIPMDNNNKNQIILSQDELEQDKQPWYALRVFTNNSENIEAYFKDNGLESFIPKQYVDVMDKTDHVKHVLRPVVNNLLFLKKTDEEPKIREIITKSNYKISVIKKNSEHQDYYEIPAKQMFEFQAMCNPEIAMRQFLSEEEAKLKTGTLVRVKFGPLKGLTGKLVRSNKKYFLLKDIPGIAVMLKVSRWCCKPFEETK